MKNTLSFLLLVFFALWGMRCSNYACSAPPPLPPAFVLMRQDFTPVLTEANAKSFEIRYDENGVKRSLTNFELLKTKGGITKFVTRDFLQATYQNKPFTLYLEGKMLGNLQITTYRNDSKCNSWIDIGEIRFENRWASKVSDGSESYYLVFVE